MDQELQRVKHEIDNTTNQLALNINALINAVRLLDNKLTARVDELDTTLATEIERVQERARGTLAEAVRTINACLKKIRSDAHKGIVANQQRMTRRIDKHVADTACYVQAVQQRARVKRNELAALCANRRQAMEDSFTAETAALAKRLDNLADQVDENAPHS